MNVIEIDNRKVRWVSLPFTFPDDSVIQLGADKRLEHRFLDESFVDKMNVTLFQARDVGGGNFAAQAIRPDTINRDPISIQVTRNDEKPLVQGSGSLDVFTFNELYNSPAFAQTGESFNALDTIYFELLFNRPPTGQNIINTKNFLFPVFGWINIHYIGK